MTDQTAPAAAHADTSLGPCATCGKNIQSGTGIHIAADGNRHHPACATKAKQPPARRKRTTPTQ
jgi:ribosomal protein L24E